MGSDWRKESEKLISQPVTFGGVRGRRPRPFPHRSAGSSLFEEDDEDCGVCDVLDASENVKSHLDLPPPPGLREIGNHSWTLLHSIAAYYPDRPSEERKKHTRQFLEVL